MMLTSTRTRAGLVTGLLFSLTIINAAGPIGFTAHNPPGSSIDTSTVSKSIANETGAPMSPDPLSSTSVYYTVRVDPRRCAAPMCGGYWVTSVNSATTRCHDGKWVDACYVSDIDWNGQPSIDRGSLRRALLRGTMSQRGIARRRSFGVFRATEVWTAASDNRPAGIFYRVTDRNVRCITHPCPTHHAAKLNSTVSRNIAGVDLNSAGASPEAVSEASERMTSPGGVIVAGVSTRVTGPGGKGESLKASQFYLRSGGSMGKKPCMKTGCSNTVCADEPRITTCEWRPEYACYQRARCERQPNGECGFTRTPELTACLARR